MKLPLYQYRSPKATYLFRKKRAGAISFTIFDASQKILFKKTLRNRETFYHLMVSQLLANKKIVNAIDFLATEKFFPEEHALTKQKLTDEVVERAIRNFKQKIKCEYKTEKDIIIETLICPITQDIFKEAVTDSHGHTFEKTAIEQHLKNSNLCPLNRQPITLESLVSNKSLQKIVDNLNRSIAIPQFEEAVIDNHGHTFEKKSIEIHRQYSELCPFSREPLTALVPNRLLQDIINSVKQSDCYQLFSPQLKEKDFLLAEEFAWKAESYKKSDPKKRLEFQLKAFQHSHHWRDLLSLLMLFKALNQQKNSYLANLYLARYQLKAKRIVGAILTLSQLKPLQNFCAESVFMVVDLLSKKPLQEPNLAKKIIESHLKDPGDKKKAYKKIIANVPDCYDLYFQVAALESDSREKSHIFYKGTLEAIARGNRKQAITFNSRAQELSSGKTIIDDIVTLALHNDFTNREVLRYKISCFIKDWGSDTAWENVRLAYKIFLSLVDDETSYRKLYYIYALSKKNIECIESISSNQDSSKAFIDIISQNSLNTDFPKYIFKCTKKEIIANLCKAINKFHCRDERLLDFMAMLKI